MTVPGGAQLPAAEERTRVSSEAGPAGTTCDLTRRTADLTVDPSALAAAYLGGSRLRDALVARLGAADKPGPGGAFVTVLAPAKLDRWDRYGPRGGVISPWAQ